MYVSVTSPSTSSWTITTYGPSVLPVSGWGQAFANWDALVDRVLAAGWNGRTEPGPWRAALRDAATAVQALTDAGASPAEVFKRVGEVAERLDDHGHRAVWTTRCLRAGLQRPAFVEAVGRWLARSPVDPWARRLTSWAYDLPVVARYLVQDVRFWRACGQDPYSRWMRVMDDPVQQAWRLWNGLERREQDAIADRRSLGVTAMGAVARAQVRTVTAMETSGVLRDEAAQPWAQRWLLGAVEWGSLARIRAAVNAGVRLDHLPGHRASEVLRTVVRGCFYDLDGPPWAGEPHRLERRKDALWALLLDAGLPRSDPRDLDHALERMGPGNAGVLRREVLRGQAWAPAMLRAFLTLHTQRWEASTDAGESPLAWARRHGVRPARWTREVVLGMLAGMDRAVDQGATVDGLMVDLRDLGVRWRGTEASTDGVVAQAVRHGIGPLGLNALAGMGADFLWRGGRGQTVLMAALADPRSGSRWPVIEALMAAAHRAHGAAADTLVHVLDHQRASVLHWAARGLDLTSVQRLLAQGLDATAIDTQGRSPLHWAARRCRGRAGAPLLHMVRALQQAGADPLAVHRQGRSALDGMVAAAPLTVMVELLRPHVRHLHTPRPGGSWYERLRERGEDAAPVLETLDLLAVAEGAMLSPEAPRTVRRL